MSVDGWDCEIVRNLTGRRGAAPAPLDPGFTERVDSLAAEVGARASRLAGRSVRISAPGLLAERAAILGLSRGGDWSCGGSSRLFPTGDGEWIAATMARPDDWASVAAWLGVEAEEGDWDVVARAASLMRAGEVIERATLLALPVGVVGESEPDESWCARHSSTFSMALDTRPPRLVVDLSTMWAGPLAGRLLAAAGMTVVKVESPGRPDGTRLGSPAHYRALNHVKDVRSIDLSTVRGLAEVSALIDTADIVITSNRQRALDQLGLSPIIGRVVERGGCWLSVTGYGIESGRVAFGDDAAAAGGVVTWDDRGPCFVLDAVADPLAGLAGACGVLRAVADDGPRVVDVAMAVVAATLGGGAPGRDAMAPIYL